MTKIIICDIHIDSKQNEAICKYIEKKTSDNPKIPILLEAVKYYENSSEALGEYDCATPSCNTESEAYYKHLVFPLCQNNNIHIIGMEHDEDLMLKALQKSSPPLESISSENPLAKLLKLPFSGFQKVRDDFMLSCLRKTYDKYDSFIAVVGATHAVSWIISGELKTIDGLTIIFPIHEDSISDLLNHGKSLGEEAEYPETSVIENLVEALGITIEHIG